MQYLDTGRAAGARHIVVDPRRTATAAGSHLHLQPLPGTDLALANGLLHIAIREGLVDEAYIADRTTGFDAVRAAVDVVLARPGRADHRGQRRASAGDRADAGQPTARR